MRTIIPLFLTPLLFFTAHAQTPSIKVDGKESGLVYLQKLNAAVTINGAIATTTWTMTFANRSGRILEGQLDFPLPEGTSISRYALDIDGRLREAVPVEKEKGAQVFEKIERRRVDPGLLEKVEGNSFRTRIYPINPKGTRTVLIAYQQELSIGPSQSLRYHLPLAFRQALEECSLSIVVFRGSIRPVFEDNIDNELAFDQWEDSWSASRSWKNFRADRSLTIRIPKSPDGMEAMMQQSGNHYFYNVSVFPQQKKIAKALPRHITILWDASLSGLSRNQEKEIGLLESYFSRLKDLAVTLVEFSNTVRGVRDFTIHDGQWESLRTALKDIVYDGATQFGVLDPGKYPCDEYLLFSDGRSNFGSPDMSPAGRPVYAIVSTANTDFPALRYITERSGGELIDLERNSIEEGRQQLLYQNLYFLGVKHQAGLEESYPALPTPVVNGISVAGISDQPAANLVLQFGYGGKVISEMKVRLDFARQKTSRLDLTRVWAQKKIADLDKRYEENKLEIGQLGRRYGIVTRNTSLIVLETVADYLTYEIEPPAELRAEYDALIKQRGQRDRQVRRTTKDNALAIFNELLEWWRTDHKRSAPIPVDDRLRLDTVLQGRVSGVRIRGAASNGVVLEDARVAREEAPPGASQFSTRTVGAADNAVLSAPRRSSQQERRMVRDDLDKAELKKQGNDPEEEGPDNTGSAKFRTWKPNIRTAYLARLHKARPADQYTVYLEARKENLQTPLFYFNTANFFFDAGKKDLGLRILSNIAELDVESYELYKLLGYKLRALGEKATALSTFRKVLDWRPFEPQSYRDYALALQDAGHYQQALDTLYAGLIRNYDADINALYPGIEETFLPEINNIIALRMDKVNFSRIPKELVTNMPVDIRVVLNWNMSDTDMDLWVTDPDEEKCYYSHRNTAMGGRISQDFTRGLGPEQFMLKKAIKGKYKVEVNYYGDTQVKLAGPTTILVEVYTHYGTPQQTRRLLPLQMQSSNEKTVLIGEFEFQ